MCVCINIININEEILLLLVLILLIILMIILIILLLMCVMCNGILIMCVILMY